MLQVICTVFYADTGEFCKRVIDWDDPEQRRKFARRANQAIRDGGKVTTERFDARQDVNQDVNFE
jgi:hypothetical protein